MPQYAKDACTMYKESAPNVVIIDVTIIGKAARMFCVDSLCTKWAGMLEECSRSRRRPVSSGNCGVDATEAEQTPRTADNDA